MLDPQRERLLADLRGLIKGDVYCDTAYAQIYATDASLYEMTTLGVVFPRSAQDISTVIRYAAENHLSIHPRGSGSGRAGGALGKGIILDLSRHMRRVLEKGKEHITVQAGMQRERLEEILAVNGRIFEPDPGNIHASTVGGMVAVDGFGPHWCAAGRPSDWLLGMEMVTANGDILSINEHEPIPNSLDPLTHSIPAPESDHRDAEKAKQFLISQTADILRSNQKKLDFTHHQNVVEQMGYRLNVLEGNQLDLLRLVAGSEGTLGVITNVKLRTMPAPKHRMMVLLMFRSLEQATLAVPHILAFHPSACELMDRRHIHLASERDVRLDLLFSDITEAVILLDFTDDSQLRLRNRICKMAELIISQKNMAFQMVPAWDTQEENIFWKLAETAQSGHKIQDSLSRAVSFMEDVAVPPTKLHLFLMKTLVLLRNRGITASVYCHAMQGQVRIQPLLDLSKAEDRIQLLQITADYYELVHHMNGSIGPESGAGLCRSEYLPDFLGPQYEICKKIKHLFDPNELFNPGKIGSHSLLSASENLRNLPDFSQDNTVREMDDEKSQPMEENLRRNAYATSAPLDSEISPGAAFLADYEMNAPFSSNIRTSLDIHEKTDVLQSSPELTESIRSSREQDILSIGGKVVNLTPSNSAPALNHTNHPVINAPRYPESSEENVNSSVISASSEFLPASSRVFPDTSSNQDASSIFGAPVIPQNVSDASGTQLWEDIRRIVGEPFGETDDSQEATQESMDPSNSSELESITKMDLEWNTPQIRNITWPCNGCADCRTTQGRMCPMFHLEHEERCAPRSKVALSNGILCGQLTLPELGNAHFRKIMNSCLQCHSCRVECPHEVDVPLLVRRAAEGWARARGLNFYESFMARLDNWLALARHFAPISNRILRSTLGRWCLEKIFGLARGRKLPQIHSRTFLEHIRKTSEFKYLLEQERELPKLEDVLSEPKNVLSTRGYNPVLPRRVAFFLDSYANRMDHSLAMAVIKVLEHNGVSVYVPPQQVGSAINSLIMGRADRVHRSLIHNVTILSDLIREGYDIICAEPATTLAFCHELPQTFPDYEELKLVSNHFHDVGAYLWNMHMNGELNLNFHPLHMTLGYHLPCRLRALDLGTPGIYLLGLIPELEVVSSKAGCCGMAGIYGLQACNYQNSLRLGRHLHAWLRNPAFTLGVTECSACKIQMEQHTSKPAIHPIKLLALSYGIMPEIDDSVHMLAHGLTVS